MSIHPDILELIHADIDGRATDAQQATLREAITRNADVREEYRKLKGLTQILASIPREEPPTHLAPRILARFRSQRDTAPKGLLGRLYTFLPAPGVAVRYGYAVAAGVVLGVLGLHVATGGSLFGPAFPDREATATLLAPAKTSRLDLAPAGVQGVATLRPSPSGPTIGVDLMGGEPVELVLRYDPSVDGGRVDVVVVRTGEAVPAGSLRLPRKD